MRCEIELFMPGFKIKNENKKQIKLFVFTTRGNVVVGFKHFVSRGHAVCVVNR